MLTRKQAIWALLAIPLGGFRGVSYAKGLKTGPAHLTVDLNEWAGIKVSLGKETLVLTPREIFEALKG